jgi:hypothetical protein
VKVKNRIAVANWNRRNSQATREVWTPPAQVIGDASRTRAHPGNEVQIDNAATSKRPVAVSALARRKIGIAVG